MSMGSNLAATVRNRVFERWIASGTTETLDEWRARMREIRLGQRVNTVYGNVVIYGNWIANSHPSAGIRIAE